MSRDSLQDIEARWEKLTLLQNHYKQFDTLLIDVIESFMGFTCTDIQRDIGEFLSQGPDRAMIQAQRGQAKTTITAIYAVWRLIHDPTTRILIVSAGGPLAKEIANWIIQIVMGLDVLECLRPDASNGDRQSVEAFDVHYGLKGPEKSPSVACLGVTSNIQGRRADLLIADDIESSKNAASELQRETLRKLTKDFTSICSRGKIVYLGTPQSVDSVYNGLPSRGYSVRIWTGRYPTEEEMKNYGNALAPLLQKRMANDESLRTGGGPTGERGKPVDPVLLGEDELTRKEIDQGRAYFQLQHMLDTKLMDADRYPIKLDGVVFMDVPPDRAPISVNMLASPEYILHPPQDFPVDAVMYQACSYSEEWGEYQGTHMYVDPSGGGKNGDEMAYAVTRFLSGTIYVVDVGGFPGGLSDANKAKLVDIAFKWGVDHMEVETNYGGEIFIQVLAPLLIKKFKGHTKNCGITGVHEVGQKELRIIDTLEPLIGARRLIMDKNLIQKDWNTCAGYALEKRGMYSLFFQMARITRDRGCLGHDDRIDALAGSCRYWADMLAVDKEREITKMKNEEYRKLMQDPLGNGRHLGDARYNAGPPNIFETLRR